MFFGRRSFRLLFIAVLTVTGPAIAQAATNQKLNVEKQSQNLIIAATAQSRADNEISIRKLKGMIATRQADSEELYVKLRALHQRK